jgi:hypothetical protein
MERLNYFNPYVSKSDNHEDQLTRAYLVLMRHSFHVFSIFLDYCKSRHELAPEETTFNFCNMLQDGWEIATQKSNPDIESNWLLSVLMTDANIGSEDTSVKTSERNARYDGIIKFGPNLTIIIENKPRSSNVWFDQLNPAKNNLSDGVRIYAKPALLEWKEIIRQLNHLVNLPSISGYEKTMIEDFLSFIDTKFPFLNPYDNFYLCKGYPELIYRRIQNLLKAIVKNEEIIKYHNSWGYSIEVNYDQIKKIGLIFHKGDDEWWLELSLYFGNTQSQSRAFYSHTLEINQISSLYDKGWWFDIDFHFAYITSNLVWIKQMPDADAGKHVERYVDFWIRNKNEIYQLQREGVQEYVDWLQSENVLVISQEVKEKLGQEFFKTKRENLNVCPGLGAIYNINGGDAEKLDKEGQLESLIHQAIIDALQLIGRDGSEFLKKLK